MMSRKCQREYEMRLQAIEWRDAAGTGNVVDDGDGDGKGSVAPECRECRNITCT